MDSIYIVFNVFAILFLVAMNGFAKTWIGPLGSIFMNMIKMVIVPLVFASLVIGVCNLGDIKKVGKLGIKTVVYYLGTTAFAIVIGLALGTIFQPGVGMTMPGAGVKVAAKAAPNLMNVIVAIFYFIIFIYSIFCIIYIYISFNMFFSCFNQIFRRLQTINIL